MIKEKEVVIKINQRNISNYISLGYDVSLEDKELKIKVEDLMKGSRVKVTALCELCGSEKNIVYNKYLANKNRNGKNYYSCYSCKNIEKEKTCLKKYGVKSYSMTDEFKKSESEKWKGIQKGGEKYKKTMIEKYGVDCYFKTSESRRLNSIWMSSDEFLEKSKKTMMEKYGVDHFSKTDEFKKNISDKKDIILSKMKKTFYEKYGIEFYSKTKEFKENLKNKKTEIVESIKKTCLERYGVDNVSKVPHIMNKMKKTKIEKGIILPDELLTEWELYKREVKKVTNLFKKELFEKWNGYDYYDSEFIKGNLSYSHINKNYPTIDHKISVYYGFVNNIPPVEIGHISNLCITKRFINSKKRELIESEFQLK